uniref:Uncharacterized protein n=1 Tax=Anguilla anguilla TaxID=7936 RepID=A0A0E9WL18_ANGAN
MKHNPLCKLFSFLRKSVYVYTKIKTYHQEKQFTVPIKYSHVSW